MSATAVRKAEMLACGQDIPKVDADRLEGIRARVREGGCVTDAVLRATARAIIERGDV